MNNTNDGMSALSFFCGTLGIEPHIAIALHFDA